jgi:hypothetical protein
VTADEQRRVAQEIVATIERNLLSKRWFCGPPAVFEPFDRQRCEEDIRFALAKFPTVPDESQ